MADLTVSELARAIAPTISGQQADPELLIRRIRHWTLAGVLTPTGSTHAGTGRHRLYDAETAYLAAVINSLAELSLPIGVLKFVADTLSPLPKLSGLWSALWRRAIEGAERVFLTLAMSLPSSGSEKPFMGLTIDDEAGFLCGVGNIHGCICINLTWIFQRIVPPG